MVLKSFSAAALVGSGLVLWGFRNREYLYSTCSRDTRLASDIFIFYLIYLLEIFAYKKTLNFDYKSISLIFITFSQLYSNKYIL